MTYEEKKQNGEITNIKSNEYAVECEMFVRICIQATDKRMNPDALHFILSRKHDVFKSTP